MGMLLVVGGAYSGKRKVVKERLNHCTWISAYDNQTWQTWSEKQGKGINLIFEGWEKWIEKEMDSGKKMEEAVGLFQALIRTLARDEQELDSTFVLVMLEMGRGIVPLEKKIGNYEIAPDGFYKKQQSMQMKFYMFGMD